MADPGQQNFSGQKANVATNDQYSKFMSQAAEKLKTTATTYSQFAKETLDPTLPVTDDISDQFRSRAEELQSLILELDKRHKAASTSRKISEKLQLFVNGISRYTAVVDTFVQSDPTVSALVWGGAKFLLQVAIDYEQHFQQLTETLEGLGPLLYSLGTLGETFDWCEELCKHIVDSYDCILGIWEEAVKIYGTRGGKSLVKGLKGILSPNDKVYKAFREKLEKKLEQVKFCAQAAKACHDRKTQEDREINCWLQTPSYDPLYRNCIRSKHPGTCNWLLEDPTFTKWEKNIRSNSQGTQMSDNLLWINGSPGVGKTILASSIIEKLVGQQREVIYYFFRNEKAENSMLAGKGELISLLRSLAMQLVKVYQRTRGRKLPPSFWERLRESNGVPLSAIEDGLEVVLILLRVLPRVYLVIDGLDECIDRNQPISSHSTCWEARRLPWVIEKLVKGARYGIANWCFTGCPEDDLTRLFQRLKAPSVTVTSAEVMGDVLNYFVAKLDEAISKDPNLGNDMPVVLQTIVRCLEGCNFLDAKLTAEMLLLYDTSPATLLAGLCTYCPGFNERYLRGLLRIAHDLHPEERKLARKIFSFMTISERPLRENELLDAIAAGTGVNTHAESIKQRPRLGKIVELCSPFIQLDDPIEDKHPLVRFTHRTAYEFFMQDPNQIKNLPGDCHDFFRSNEDRHLELGIACLTYLSYTDHAAELTLEMEKLLHDNDDQLSFLKYASIYWHLHLTPAKGNQQMFNMVKSFIRGPKFLVCLWVLSQFAPYQLARLEANVDKNSYHLTTPKEVYMDKAGQYFADIVPGWLQDYNEEGAKLARSCHTFVKEFGLVLLRKPGGIKQCHPGSLGQWNCFASLRDKWMSYSLEDSADSDVKLREDLGWAEKHSISVSHTPEQLNIKASRITMKASAPASLHLQDWKVVLKKNQKPKYGKYPPKCVSIPSNTSRSDEIIIPLLPLDSDTFASHQLDRKDALVSLGQDVPGLFLLGPGEMVQDIHLELPPDRTGKRLELRGKECATNNLITAVSYSWLASLDNNIQQKGAKEQGAIAGGADSGDECEFDDDSDSDSDCSSIAEELPKDAGGADSGYSSLAGSEITKFKRDSGYVSLVVLTKSQEPRWFHFETADLPVRQPQPAFHPKKPIVLLPLYHNWACVVNYEARNQKEVAVSLGAIDNGDHARASAFLHFSPSGDILHYVSVTRDFSDGFKWNISLSNLEFHVENDTSDTPTYTLKPIGTTTDKSSPTTLSWDSPYRNPYEKPDHPLLPFSLYWTPLYLYITFGACEVYIARISLPGSISSLTDPQSTTTTYTPHTQLLKYPAYLPASTTDRPFKFLPSITIKDKEHHLFILAGNAELPASLIWKDVVEDMGGWVDYEIDKGMVVGRWWETEEGGWGCGGGGFGMRGEYAGEVLGAFKLPIRCGLAWNTRVQVVCGLSE